MVVGNFLNLLTVSAIILVTVVLTLGVSNHIRYTPALQVILISEPCPRTSENNALTNTSDEGRIRAIKSIIFQSSIETILQIHVFLLSPALRYSIYS